MNGWNDLINETPSMSSYKVVHEPPNIIPIKAIFVGRLYVASRDLNTVIHSSTQAHTPEACYSFLYTIINMKNKIKTFLFY